jgi:hypothetical protein
MRRVKPGDILSMKLSELRTVDGHEANVSGTV